MVANHGTCTHLDNDFQQGEPPNTNLFENDSTDNHSLTETPIVVDIPVRQRLSEYAFKNEVLIDRQVIAFETTLMKSYLAFESLGTYSTKVFLGGLPHDTQAYEIKKVFEVFGEIKLVEWPDSTNHPVYPPNGFAFIVYKEEKSVHHLLNYTKKDQITGALYVWFKSQSDFKPIEIRPWKCEDSTFVQRGFHQINKPKGVGEVFIGGIPRSFTAGQLASILEEYLKVDVFSVVIDVDNQHRYPKGTAKVTFFDALDAWKAISINKISIRMGNQLKHMEIKPFKKNVHSEQSPSN